MELSDEGDLYQRIQKVSGVQQGNFQENEVWKILIQVSENIIVKIFK